MPASFKFAWRWMVGATAATILCLAALPSVGRAESAMQGVVGDPGLPGPQGPQGAPGIQGPAGGQGDSGPQGPQGAIGPTGPTGPAGIMGEDGVRGPTGLIGTTGATGTPGISEPNISVFTGGSLGTLGSLNGTDLSGNNSVGSPGTILILGPGNGSDSAAPPASSANPEDAEVIMAEAGTAKRLFVNVDNDPGTQMNNGIPSTFSFFLCNGNGFPDELWAYLLHDGTRHDLQRSDGHPDIRADRRNESVGIRRLSWRKSRQCEVVSDVRSRRWDHHSVNAIRSHFC